MTNGNPALQFGLDYQHDSGWFGGAWATTVDMSSSFGRRYFEFDYYAGFHVDTDSNWTATLTLMRYTYPGATGRYDYDHNELLLGAAWNNRYFVELGYTRDLYGLDRIGKYWALRSEWPLNEIWMAGVGLGGNDFSDVGTSHFMYWDLGVTASVSRFSFDFRYYEHEPTDGFILGPRSAKPQFAASVTASF